MRTTRIGAGLQSPAKILHGRNLTTRAQAEIDIKAIRSVLQERQLKMMLDHDSSRLSGYHADTPITIKAEPFIWPTAALINIHEHPI